jgi:HEAT repeat protein
VATGRARAEALANDDARECVRVSLTHELFYEGLVGDAHHLKDELTWALLRDELGYEERYRAARVMRLSRVTGGDMGKVATRIALDDSQPRALRVECLGVVGQSRLTAAVPHLCNVVDREGPAFQGPAIVALGKLGSPQAAGTLLNHYDDSNGGMQPHIELAMWRLGRDFRDEDFSAWAQGALEFAPHSVYFLGGRLLPTFQPSIAREALASEDPRARREGALLLGALGDGSERAALEERLMNETDPLNRNVLEKAVALARERNAAPRPP